MICVKHIIVVSEATRTRCLILSPVNYILAINTEIIGSLCGKRALSHFTLKVSTYTDAELDNYGQT